MSPPHSQDCSPPLKLLPFFFWLIPSSSRYQHKKTLGNTNPQSKAPAGMEREEMTEVLNTSGVPESQRSREGPAGFREGPAGFRAGSLARALPRQGLERTNPSSHSADVIAVNSSLWGFPGIYIITALSICQTLPLALPPPAPQPGLGTLGKPRRIPACSRVSHRPVSAGKAQKFLCSEGRDAPSTPRNPQGG